MSSSHFLLPAITNCFPCGPLLHMRSTALSLGGGVLETRCVSHTISQPQGTPISLTFTHPTTARCVYCCCPGLRCQDFPPPSFVIVFSPACFCLSPSTIAPRRERASQNVTSFCSVPSHLTQNKSAYMLHITMYDQHGLIHVLFLTCCPVQPWWPCQFLSQQSCLVAFIVTGLLSVMPFLRDDS